MSSWATRSLAVAGLLLSVLPGSAHSQVVGEVAATDASIKGSVVLVGGRTRLLNGSSLTAGESTAAIQLTRGGGSLNVCPHTGVSVTASQSGTDLMIAMNNGAIETRYTLSSSADTIMTPDFRILLPGPGSFHFAIAADARGNTCIRPLEGNTASLVVSEVMGTGVYHLGPTDQVLFREGRVSSRDPLVPPDCGCGPPPTPIRHAQQPAAPAKPAQGNVEQPAPAPSNVPAKIEFPEGSAEATIAEFGRQVQRASPRQPANGDLHVEVDAPLIFNAGVENPGPGPLIARVRLTPLPPMMFDGLDALPPKEVGSPRPEPAAASTASGTKEKKRGFLRRIGAFFAGIFK